MRVKITMHVLARFCDESEKNVAKKFGGTVSGTFVDVETKRLVHHALDGVCGRQRQRE